MWGNIAPPPGPGPDRANNTNSTHGFCGIPFFEMLDFCGICLLIYIFHGSMYIFLTAYMQLRKFSKKHNQSVINRDIALNQNNYIKIEQREW